MFNFTNDNNISINSLNISISPCSVSLTNESECYCPKDFYGYNCQFSNPIECAMDYTII